MVKQRNIKRKQIIFDIDTNVCRKIFGDKNFRQPYGDIKDYFEKNDCTHIEGSSYMSNYEMNNVELSNLIDDLLENYPYLKKCIKKMHQSDISNIHSLEGHFDYDGTAGKFEKI